MKEKTMDFLQKVFDAHQTKIVVFKGDCHDCHKPVKVGLEMELDGKLEIRGGAIYPIRQQDYTFEVFYKCDKCYGQNPMLTNYQGCEVYSRCVGYLRPVKQMNPGKQAEVENRKMFNMEGYLSTDQKEH